ncbi:MAG TPA: geranylgeranylglycerol-phosphate geranylgeranyltransferase [Bacteroidales bacterium]
MIQFLRLIRWPNLLIIILSMAFMLYFLINPMLGMITGEAGLNYLEFGLLVIATVFISIGGYLINDFFDMDIDEVNKPGKNQVGRYFSVYSVQVMYWIFTVLGILAGVLLSWMLNQINYSLLFVFCAGLLWFYSERYQNIPIVGNLVIASLSALSFGIVWLFQFFALSNDPHFFVTVQASFPLVNRLVLIYMAFAFLTSLLREFVKDIEDIKGDERFGSRTFAVVFGERKARYFASVFALIGLAGSIWIQVIFLNFKFWILFGYFFLLDAMFVTILFWIFRANESSNYRWLSNFIKILMLLGVLSMLLFYLET